MLRLTPRELREKLGLSQGEAADRMGISRSYYNQIENGERVPSYRMVRRMAEFFGVPMDHLYFPALEYANREHRASSA